jgi:hypothetical protein
LPAGIAAHHALTASAPPAARDDRPNFLFMIADDLTYRSIHSLNNREVHTPNLDRFVASGSVRTIFIGVPGRGRYAFQAAPCSTPASRPSAPSNMTSVITQKRP